MNGVHDMGGMHGFGKVEPEPNEPVFHAPWEGRVLAMQRAMSYTGAWNIGAQFNRPDRSSLLFGGPSSALGQSMTRSARSSSECGIVSPSTLAVFALMTISKRTGRCTGNSPGFAPLRILST